MAYLLDSNVFVNAKRDYYGFDFCPAFWDWVDVAAAFGTVASVEAVYDELSHGVPCVLPFHMLRVERPRFILEGAQR